MVGTGLAIIYLLPRFTKVVPSPLVAIIVFTVVAILLKLDVRRVGDLENYRHRCRSSSGRKCHGTSKRFVLFYHTPWGWPLWGFWNPC